MKNPTSCNAITYNDNPNPDNGLERHISWADCLSNKTLRSRAKFDLDWRLSGCA